MNKQLTPLEVSKQLKDFVIKFVKNGLDRTFIHGSFDIIENELKRLERIDLYFKVDIDNKFHNYIDLTPIDKKLKALEIIKEKQIDMYRLKDAIEFTFEADEDAVEFYNKDYREDFCITVEEFDLLKEVLK